MKKIIAAALIAVITVCVLTACAKKEEEPTTDTQTTQTTTQTTTESTTQTTTATTTKKLGKAFDKWDTNDLAEYFKKEKVFTEKDYLGVYTDVEELPDGVSGEIEYSNHKNGEIDVLIFYLDKDSKNSKTQKIYEKIKKDKCFEWEEGGKQQPFNALVGRFAIFYSASLDENFIKEFEKTLDKLIKKENITPEYYEKDLDLSKFKLDDDVIIVEGDD